MSHLKVLGVCVGMVQTNCYIVYEEERKEAVIIDPGDEASRLMKIIQDYGLLPKAILLTHAHFDHIMAVPELKEHYQIPIYAHEKERVVCEDASVNLSGSWMRTPLTIHPDVYLTDDEIVEAAGLTFKTLYTPGHTIGSVSYYMEKEKVLFSGDTLFCRSLGRTDLETASTEMIIDSILNKLLVLPDEVVVYPGHNNETTIAAEKKYNPVAMGYRG